MADIISQGYKSDRAHVGYVGDIKSNLPGGYGVYNYPNRFFQYEGEWQQGVKDGLGALKMKDGSYYKGQFSNGEIDGCGLRFWAYNGNTYEGEFVKGEMLGKGVMKYGNGNVYEGSWLDNMRHGDGVLTEADGSVYDGSFYCHKRHGEGKQKYSDGGIYEGGWINNMRHGHGKMIFKDGGTYKGQWKACELHGEGSLVSQITYSGMWNNGRPTGEPTSICLVGDQEINVEQNEMPFSIHIECRTLDNEVTSESGRCLQVIAGVHLLEKDKMHISPSRISAASTGNDSLSLDSKENVVGRRTTPFGYDVDPYPVYTKVVLHDITEGEEMRSISTGSPLSAENSIKDDTPTMLTPTTPPTRIKSARDAAKIMYLNREDSLSFEYCNIAIQRTVNGKASFLNLVLPNVDYNSLSMLSMSPENTEGKTPSRRKTDVSKTIEESGSGRRKKIVKAKQEDKSEEVASDQPYKSGDYVLIIEDVTECPILDNILEPIYIPMKVPQHVKGSRSTKAANTNK